jgi:hypothetical protein
MTCSSFGGPSTSMGWATRQARTGRWDHNREAGLSRGGGFGVGAVTPDGGGCLAVANDDPRYSCNLRGQMGVRERPPIRGRTSTDRAYRGGEMAAIFQSNPVKWGGGGRSSGGGRQKGDRESRGRLCDPCSVGFHAER